MSARDAIAEVFRLQHQNVCYPNASSGECLIAADAIIADLTAAGFSIVHKDEIHAPSVERAIAVARDWAATARSVGQPESESMADDIATALRELMKEVGRG